MLNFIQSKISFDSCDDQFIMEEKEMEKQVTKIQAVFRGKKSRETVKVIKFDREK